MCSWKVSFSGIVTVVNKRRYTLKINPADLDRGTQNRSRFFTHPSSFCWFSEGPFILKETVQWPCRAVIVKILPQIHAHEQQDQVIYPFISQKTKKSSRFLPFVYSFVFPKGHQKLCVLRTQYASLNHSLNSEHNEIHNESHYSNNRRRTLKFDETESRRNALAVGTCTRSRTQ